MSSSTQHRQLRSSMAAIGAVVVALLASACGGDSSPPAAPSTGSSSSSSSSSGSPVNVTGNEKIGWDQPANSASDLARLQYLGFVDDIPQTLTNASCGTSSSSGSFACSATLPRMTAGTHRLELAAQEIDGARQTGPRSPAIVLNVGSSSSRATALVMDAPRSLTTFDGVPIVVETVAAGLAAPSSLAAAADGRVFIAGRDGNVLVWKSGRIFPAPALTLSDVAQTSDVGLIGLALDPDFASNGRVFVAYTARNQSGGFVHRILRLRDNNSVFSEAVAVLEERALFAPMHPPRVRVAADHLVYVTLPASDQSTAESYRSYEGKLLRINQDGTTPAANQPPSPVVATGQAVVGGFDWNPATGRLWLAGRDWQSRDFVLDFLLGPRAAATFESPVDPSGAAFYGQRRIAAFANDLFIGALNGRHLRRVHFDRSNPNKIEITEHLLDGLYGRISDVAVGPDGALYFVTSNTGTTSAAADDDRLLRVTSAN
jgi:glucose/arabinose dehydrogenase